MTTVTRVALCTVKVCPQPRSPDFHACVICQAPAVEHHHVKNRGMGGSPSCDKGENIVCLCHRHHEERTLNKWRDVIRGGLYVQITGEQREDYHVFEIPGVSSATEEQVVVGAGASSSVAPGVPVSSDGGKVSGTSEQAPVMESSYPLDAGAPLPLSPGAGTSTDGGDDSALVVGDNSVLEVMPPSAGVSGASTAEGEVIGQGAEKVSSPHTPDTNLRDGDSALPSAAGVPGASTDGGEGDSASSQRAALPPSAGVPEIAPDAPSDAGQDSRESSPFAPETLPSVPPSISDAMMPSGLELPDEFTFEEWASLGGMIGGVVRNRQWWTGDWVLAGERFGERYSQHLDATGYTYESLANCVSVCRRFPHSLRNELLTFSHHAVVAKLDDGEARNWLSLAEDKRWSVAEFRRQVWGRSPRTVRWTLEDLRQRLVEWPGEMALRNNGRKFAEAWLDWLASGAGAK